VSFSTYEMSRSDGQAASLFLIQWGTASSSYFAYTDSDVPITFDGVEYQPVVIGRAEVESSGTLDRKALEIDITPNAEVVRLFAQTPPSIKVGMIIRQGHVNDPDADFPVVWTGVIKNVNWEPPLAKIVGEPLDTLLARPGLRRHYMFGCPHVLYDARTCKANKETLKKSLSPTFVGANFVRFGAAWHGATNAEKYIGGYMEWSDTNGNTQIRTCLDFGSDQNEIVIGNTDGLTIASVIFVYAGCARNVNDCANLHANIVNFGGQPYIPAKNPVAYVNRYY